MRTAVIHIEKDTRTVDIYTFIGADWQLTSTVRGVLSDYSVPIHFEGNTVAGRTANSVGIWDQSGRIYSATAQSAPWYNQCHLRRGNPILIDHGDDQYFQCWSPSFTRDPTPVENNNRNWFADHSASVSDDHMIVPSSCDFIINTDIPLHFRNIRPPSKHVRCQYLGMYDGNMYAIESKLLYSRDLRMDAPYLVSDNMPDTIPDRPTINALGLIMLDGQEIHIIDIRNPSLQYTLPEPPTSSKRTKRLVLH